MSIRGFRCVISVIFLKAADAVFTENGRVVFFHEIAYEIPLGLEWRWKEEEGGREEGLIDYSINNYSRNTPLSW